MKRVQPKPSIRFRYGRPTDLPAIHSLMLSSGMSGEIDPHECLVAENKAGILGFARVEVIQQQAFIRPIVVQPSAQHQGIGRQLVQHLFDQWSELRVVSRGKVQDFYRRMGFTHYPWKDVPREIRQECELCPEVSNCQPIPMVGYREFTVQED